MYLQRFIRLNNSSQTSSTVEITGTVLRRIGSSCSLSFRALCTPTSRALALKDALNDAADGMQRETRATEGVRGGVAILCPTGR